MLDLSKVKGMTDARAAEIGKRWSWVDTGDPMFMKALDRIVGSDGNLVILGAGGTGKSILLRMAADILGMDSTVVLSSTGISAANLSGEGIVSSTVHSFFRLRPLNVYMRPSVNGKLDELLSKVRTILIDEVSMINASLMDCIMSTLELHSRIGRNMPRIILFGDVLQLAPVVMKDDKVAYEYFKEHYGGRYMFFNSPRFQEACFEIIHLDRIYRQKSSSWQNVLNRIRMGMFTSEDIDMINSRVCDERRYVKSHEFMMYLAPTNRRVDAINTFYYGDAFDDCHSYSAVCTGNFRMQDNPHLAMNVEISVGMQVMCLHNNVERGYQNGTLGVVEGFSGDDVVIRKKDGTRCTVGYEKWEQYDYMVDPVRNVMEAVVTGTFTQIGCKPAFACTVHKSQGLTLDSVYAELNGGFAEGMAYVGLSRCTTLEGIGLKYPLRRRDIVVSREALDFLDGGLRNTGIDLLI